MSDLYPVKPHVAARSHLNSKAEYDRLYRLSLDNPEWFWAEQAKALSWFHPWQTVFDADYDEVDFAWFSGGAAQRLLQLRRPPPRDARATAPRSSGPRTRWAPTATSRTAS